jgi:hypothetical protein
MRRCSSLCGFQPSVAATTNMQASTPPTPASMLRTKRTWPGTSTKLTTGHAARGGEHRVREAEVDREAAALLLGEAVGVGAGEGEHERRLAVVDVAGGGDDAHAASGRRLVARRAGEVAARWSSSDGSTVRRSRKVRAVAGAGDDRRVCRAERGEAIAGDADAGGGHQVPGAEPAPGSVASTTAVAPGARPAIASARAAGAADRCGTIRQNGHLSVRGALVQVGERGVLQRADT